VPNHYPTVSKIPEESRSEFSGYMKVADFHGKLRDLSRKACSTDLDRGVYGICVSKTHKFGAAVEM
jgi:hypothetical protein